MEARLLSGLPSPHRDRSGDGCRGSLQLDALAALVVVAMAVAATLPLLADSAARQAQARALRQATLLAQNLLEAMELNPDGVLLGGYLDAAAPAASGCEPAHLRARADLRDWHGAIRNTWGPGRGRGEVRSAGDRLEIVVAWRVPTLAAVPCPEWPSLGRGWHCLALRR